MNLSLQLWRWFSSQLFCKYVQSNPLDKRRFRKKRAGWRIALIISAVLVTVPSFLQAQLLIDGTQSQASPFNFSTLTTAEKAQAANGIVIEFLEEMTLDEDLVMNQGTSILVKHGNNWHPPAHYGGILHVKAKITTSGTNTWEGIEVEGHGANLSHFYSGPDPSQSNDISAYYGILDGRHGRVSLYENAVIEKAHIGISSEAGGIIESMDVSNILTNSNHPRFVNCETGIQIAHHWADPEQSANRIMGVEFEWNDHTIWDHLNPSGDYTADAYAHVRIMDAKGIYLGGCSYSCIDDSEYDPYGRGIGVHGYTYNPDHDPSFVVGEMGNVFYIDATSGCTKVKVYNDHSSTYGGSLLHLTYGVYTEGIGDKASVHDHLFTNNYEHIKCYPFDHMAIFNNVFNSDESALLDIFNGVYNGAGSMYGMAAIHLQNQNHLLIHNNAINRGIGVYSAPPAMWILNSLGGKILIHSNVIDGDVTAPHTNSTVAISADGDLTHFEWVCNTFDNWNVDVKYGNSASPTGNAGPIRNPTSYFPAAGNNYSSSATTNIVNNSDQDLNYFHFGAMPSKSGTSEVFRWPSSTEPDCDLDCNDVELLFDPTELSVSSIDAGSIRVFPNPASDKLLIELPGAYKLKSLVLFNSLGQMVLETDQTVLDVSQLPVGLYQVRITSVAGTVGKTVLIQR